MLCKGANFFPIRTEKARLRESVAAPSAGAHVKRGLLSSSSLTPGMEILLGEGGFAIKAESVCRLVLSSARAGLGL